MLGGYKRHAKPKQEQNKHERERESTDWVLLFLHTHVLSTPLTKELACSSFVLLDICWKPISISLQHSLISSEIKCLLQGPLKPFSTQLLEFWDSVSAINRVVKWGDNLHLVGSLC